jgi:sterol desaturase/sphingolipid hydroxylase (fatty acid hydroxylase superfamily)
MLPEPTLPAAPRTPRAGSALVHHLLVPTVLVLSVTSWALKAEGQQFLTDHAVRLDYASCVLLTLICGIFLIERLYPANPAWNGHLFSVERGGLRRDLVYLFVITQLSALLIAAAATRSRAIVDRLELPAVWPTQAPFVLKVALAFLLVELASYWLHRAAHRFPVLWQFHSTHHVITQLSGLKALRTHPIENVGFYFVRNVPLLLLGAGFEEVLAATSFGAILGILAHANVDVSERFGLLVNLPGYHAVHHSAELAESNSNFGCHTILWDRLFGTFRRAAVAPLVIGVHPVGTRTVWEELVSPFYRRVR